MADSLTVDVQLPEDKPPRWANSLMKWALTMPGLQTTVGKQVAVLSFSGRKTGKTYTIPVSYHREGDVVTVVTKKVRHWWHNFSSPQQVQIRLAGREYTGTGEARTGEEETLEFMMDFLEKRPIDAKAYGLGSEITREKVARIVPQIVVIRIVIEPTD
jgi:F420H(2)-dependent quinone reductase